VSTNETIKNKRNYYSTQVSFVFVFILNPAPLTWVYCSSNDSSQRVPGPVIKPVMKFIKSLLSQKPGSPIIKIPKARMKKKKNCISSSSYSIACTNFQWISHLRLHH
jgi:hypothetical protein